MDFVPTEGEREREGEGFNGRLIVRACTESFTRFSVGNGWEF